jgi:prevent-host-death family protein
MKTVGIRQLRQEASQLVRMVREEGREVQITYRGKPVALLIPVEHGSAEESDTNGWSTLDRLAAEIGARWPAGVSAAEAVAEARR